MNFLLEGPGGLTGIQQGGGFTTNLNATFKGAVDMSAATSVLIPAVTQTGALAITAAAASNFVPLTVTQNDTTNNPDAVSITNTGNGRGLFVNNSGTGSAARFNLTSTGNSSPGMEVDDTSTSASFGTLYVSSTRTGQAVEFNHSPASNSGIPDLTLDGTQTITGAVTDGFHATVRLKPTYSAATAQTVTRHNYLDMVNPTLSGVGPAALTDATVMRFDANAGTHKAVDAGTTKTSPGAVTQWIKINVNGTLAYIPSYSSKTS